MAAEFLPVRRASTEAELAEAALLSSLADETPEGRSIVELAETHYGLHAADMPGCRARPVHRPDPHERHRVAGPVDPQGRRRLGPALGRANRAAASRPTCAPVVERIANGGGTPLVVAGRAARARA